MIFILKPKSNRRTNITYSTLGAFGCFGAYQNKKCGFLVWFHSDHTSGWVELSWVVGDP